MTLARDELEVLFAHLPKCYGEHQLAARYLRALGHSTGQYDDLVKVIENRIASAPRPGTEVRQ